jgi:uncharacterized protein with von Willebrand factor type A (vWA) domain
MTVASVQDDYDLQESLQLRLIEFVRLAKQNGYHAGLKETMDAQRIAELCGITDSNQLFWGLRSLLCSDHDEWKDFEALFQAYWKLANSQVRYQSAKGQSVDKESAQQQSTDKGGHSSDADNVQTDGDGESAGQRGIQKGASSNETLERTDFQLIADVSSMREVERLVERLAQRMRRRVVRKQRLHRKGKQIHLRHTMRNSLRYGGVPLQLAFKTRIKRQPRLILITDVSRSMSLYSYLFLRFARGVLNAFRFAEAFAYHTRLVPISDVLRQADLKQVSESLALLSNGWSGGTRIGESLEQFNTNYSGHLNSNSVIVIVSDGLDTGDADLLTEQLVKIKRRCRKLVWLNPLLGREGYEPKAAAMHSALPFIDIFASAHNVQSLRNLEPVLTSL